jgi:hypothetical protein
VIAAILLAKLAIDRGALTPEVRLALMLWAGLGGLVWAELSLRKGYAATANAVSGAGVAILYIAFYSGHALYHLMPLSLTFVLMALVTVVAGLLAVRYDALFTALLGLLGGFATPVALSTGVDRPLGLFSYVLLLSLGLIGVALRQRWHGLVLTALAGTFLIELGWFLKFMAPEKLIVGLGAFFVLGIVYLLVPLATEAAGVALSLSAVAGGLVPFLFVIVLAGSSRYLGEWPLLFGYIGLLDAALIATALYRSRTGMLLGAAAATGLTIAVWSAQGLQAREPWGPTLAAIALVVLMNAAPRLAAWLRPRVALESGAVLEGAGLLATMGLGIFGFVLAARAGEPPWPFLTLLAALTAILIERSREGRLPVIPVLGVLATASLVQWWFFQSTTGELLLRNLSVPLLFTLVLSGIAALRAQTPVHAEAEAAVVLADFTALAGLFGCLATSRLGADPRPLFVALAVAVVMLVGSALRRDWTPLIPVGLVASALLASVWHELYFHAADVGLVLPLYAVFYVGFVVLPFVVPSHVQRLWRERPAPWLASALAGGAFFWPLYRAVTGVWGKAWIGALPVLLAAVSVAALAGVSSRFAAPRGDAAAADRRLQYLALFAAIALGFIATAIPLQLDRQWITLGWAIEAAAVWWLYGRLPHGGLKVFGAVLFVGVGVRLLFNVDSVLRYQAHGLPIFNWLLYTYGVPALCAFAGAWALRRTGDKGPLVPGAVLLGLLLVFWLINLEIFDFFTAPGAFVEFSVARQQARDLTLSVAWGLYAVTLLVIAIWRQVRALRLAALGFLLLAGAKVALYDLSALGTLYRVVSLFGLAVFLIMVSLLYGRFVVARERVS